jgi:ZIP family zinc transporter
MLIVPSVGQLIAIFVPAAALVVGAVLATARRPPVWLSSLAQHLAAGVVLASVAVELIPELRTRSPVLTAVGFSMGIALMLGLRIVVRRLGRETSRGVVVRSEGGPPIGLVAATGLDLLIDGLVLGAAFAVGQGAGIVLAIALTMELVFLGLSSVLALSKAGVAARRAIGVAVGLAATFLVGAVVGTVVLGAAPPTVLTLTVGIGAVALMYLVAEELLVEAHEGPESEANITVFFVGFLIVLIFAELGH